jgi:lysophospholipase L1-like esterase
MIKFVPTLAGNKRMKKIVAPRKCTRQQRGSFVGIMAGIYLLLAGCGGGGSGGSNIAVPDAYSVDKGQTLNVGAPGVLGNDVGSTLNAQLVGGPSHASSFTLNVDGSFSYTHNNDGAATDSFTYRATSGASSGTTTVTITINQPPLANNTCSSIQNGVSSVAATLSATDPNGNNTISSYTIPTPPSNGTIMECLSYPCTKPSPSITYVPTVPPPDTGRRGMDKIVFQANDSGGLHSSMGTVNILNGGDIRIMPLGDSITQGIFKDYDGTCTTHDTDGSCPSRNLRVGYRMQAWTDLEALSAGYGVDFVGGLSDGSSAGLAAPNDSHEGHPGDCAGPVVGVTACTADDPLEPPGTPRNLAQNIEPWLNTHPADVILLHVGTNGLNASISNVEQANATQVGALLDNISDWATKNYPVTVFVARIIKNVTGTLPVTTFNDDVATIAMTVRPSLNVILVNQETGAGINYAIDDSQSCLDSGTCSPTADMASDLHPNPIGYAKMAAKWKADIQSSGVLPNCQ